MRYLATYDYCLPTDTGGGYIGLFDLPDDAIRAAWAHITQAALWCSPEDFDADDSFYRVDVYTYGGPLTDPAEIWDTFPPLYDGADGDALHVDLSARGLSVSISGREVTS